MKKCPQCGREYDNTMMFCLDDGAELLYGPAPSEQEAKATGFQSDEPATANLSEPPASAGGQFDGPQTAILSEPTAVAGGLNQPTAQRNEPATAIFPVQPMVSNDQLQPPATAGGSDSSEKPSFSAHRAAERRESIDELSEKHSFSAHRAAKPLMVVAAQEKERSGK